LKDPSGFRPIYTAGEETSEMRKASLDTMSNVNMNNYQHPKAEATSKNSNSKFNVGKSVVRGTKSGGVNSIGSTVAGRLIKGKRVYVEYGGGLGQYSNQFTKGAKFGKGTIGVVGTVGFTAWDAGYSISRGEYVGAGIDVASGAAGFGVGYGLGILGGFALFAGAPVVLVGGAVFGTTVGVGIFIDWGAGEIKDSYYGR
jgi:hypothetical protein